MEITPETQIIVLPGDWVQVKYSLAGKEWLTWHQVWDTTIDENGMDQIKFRQGSSVPINSDHIKHIFSNDEFFEAKQMGLVE